MKTSTMPVSAPDWYVIDAEGQTLGYIATRIASVLRGKHKPTFSPHQLCGDHVIVLNAGKIAVTQQKLRRKGYFKHTGYAGHWRVTPMAEMLEKKPTFVIQKAVQRMLSKTRLREQMLKRLHLRTGTEHPYAGRKPLPFPETI